ncbi:MAG: hypothetical protein WDN00_07745 [Limisphaerales bacterium]
MHRFLARLGQVVLALNLVTVLRRPSVTENLVPPPTPAVAPLIGKTYPNDTNGDHVEDQLLMRYQEA